MFGLCRARAWQSPHDLQHVLLQLLYVAVPTWRRKYCRQQTPEMLGAACLGNLETTCSGHNRILSRALRQLPKRFHKTTKWHPRNHGLAVSLKNGGNAKTSVHDLLALRILDTDRFCRVLLLASEGL